MYWNTNKDAWRTLINRTEMQDTFWMYCPQGLLAECFYYAGGVPAIMEEIKEHLHLDVMTVTGKTLGENLEELKNNGFYEKM